MGDQKIIILTLKTAPLTVYSVENWDRKNITDSMSSSTTNSSIALQVRSKYDLSCLTRETRNSLEGNYSAVTFEHAHRLI